MAGLTLWFTGLSGSGKSTVAGLVADALRERGHKVEILDGDEIRQGLCKDLGFSREDRETNLRRIAVVADLLSRNDVIAISAAIAPYRSIRAEVRARMPDRFAEIYVAAPIEVCAERDPKGLYAKAYAGEIPQFTGVSDPYEPPLEPELTLHTDVETPEQSAAKVIDWVEERCRTRG